MNYLFVISNKYFFHFDIYEHMNLEFATSVILEKLKTQSPDEPRFLKTLRHAIKRYNARVGSSTSSAHRQLSTGPKIFNILTELQFLWEKLKAVFRMLTRLKSESDRISSEPAASGIFTKTLSPRDIVKAAVHWFTPKAIPILFSYPKEPCLYNRVDNLPSYKLPYFQITQGPGNLRHEQTLAAYAGDIAFLKSSRFSRLTNKCHSDIFGFPLLAATAAGQYETVKYLLRQGHSVNGRGTLCGPALHIACVMGFADIVTLLLENGAKLHIFHEFRQYALVAAAQGGSVEILDILINHPSFGQLESLEDPKLCSSLGFHQKITSVLGSALLAAIENRKEEAALFLIEHSADKWPYLNVKSWFLAQACRKGLWKVIKLLVSRGASINPSPIGYHTSMPLDEAVYFGDADTVQFLLDQGAKPNPVSEHHHDPLQRACCENRLDLAKILVKMGADVNHRVDPVSGGVRSYYWKFIKAPWPTPKAALEIAVSFNNEQMVLFLLENGAKVNPWPSSAELFQWPRDRHQYWKTELTPLGIACLLENTRLIDILLAHGADIKVGGWSEELWIPLAFFAKSPEVVNRLIEHGAKHPVNVKLTTDPSKLYSWNMHWSVHR
jgi:ankyrin repeat protein